MKIECKSCNRILPKICFHKNSYSKSGFAIYCKACRNRLVSHNIRVKRERKRLIKKMNYYVDIKIEADKKIDEIKQEIMKIDKKLTF